MTENVLSQSQADFMVLVGKEMRVTPDQWNQIAKVTPELKNGKTARERHRYIMNGLMAKTGDPPSNRARLKSTGKETTIIDDLIVDGERAREIAAADAGSIRQLESEDRDFRDLFADRVQGKHIDELFREMRWGKKVDQMDLTAEEERKKQREEEEREKQAEEADQTDEAGEAEEMDTDAG